MSPPSFVAFSQVLEERARGAAPAEVLPIFVALLQEEGRVDELFEARLMMAREELGLSPLDRRPLVALPDAVRTAFEERFRDGCREAAESWLERGEIARAWPYYRTLGESEAVARALDRFEVERLFELDDESWDALVKVALDEGVSPQRGFELVLARGGTCEGITVLERGAIADVAARTDCVRRLLERFHGELRSGLERSRTRLGAAAEESLGVLEVLAASPDVFTDRPCHVDDSHLQALLRLSSTVDDPSVTKWALQLAEYGCRLGAELQLSEASPFEDFYGDYRAFFAILDGRDVEENLQRFRDKAKDDPFAAEILVLLLHRSGRSLAAVTAFQEYLSQEPRLRAAPPLDDLCRAAGDGAALRDLARERGDIFMFAMALAVSPPGADSRRDDSAVE